MAVAREEGGRTAEACRVIADAEARVAARTAVAWSAMVVRAGVLVAASMVGTRAADGGAGVAEALPLVEARGAAPGGRRPRCR